jgi:hypothetical protein
LEVLISKNLLLLFVFIIISLPSPIFSITIYQHIGEKNKSMQWSERVPTILFMNSN